MNAASIECAMIAKRTLHCFVALIYAELQIESCKAFFQGEISDVADIVIDNGAPPEDSIIEIDCWESPVQPHRQ